ncbi:hypothetical protein HPB50_001204 [Hyalomma asiaticum]|uniref:Uncharacterized protein n=1 Tax=Hyalomma asiaticum TaxID=266040 RepID=A0ACB7TCI5_HYAAI|nr:hypothetical protein HPB50_001204 [Hyalomma asiaticum]
MDDDRRDRTLWCGNLDPKVTEELLRELFVQAGPVEDVKIPKDSNGQSKNFAFVTFVHPESVGYTLALMDGISLYRRRIRMQRRPQAAVDDTYVNMMKRHYEYMSSIRASTNIFHPPGTMWNSSCIPQLPMDMPMTFHSDHSFTYESASFHIGYPQSAPHAYPPINDSKCYDSHYGQDRYDRHDRHDRHDRLDRYDRHDRYDREDRHFRSADPYRGSYREFRGDKEDPDMRSKHRGRNGHDRRYQEPRCRRPEERSDFHTRRRRY